MQQVTLDEAKERLSELVDAALDGEAVTITIDDQRVVRLVPIPVQRQGGRFGSAKGQIWMSDDFEAPLEDFKDYME
jgi:prevent-host-death family protein